MRQEEALKPHKITGIIEGSIASELELEIGDTLLAINKQRIEDVFDYRYLLSDENLDILIQKKNGEEWLLEIEKDYEEDLGLIFETELMDELIRCKNKCKFCFIDQLPQNMRDTVYFKDDDWRMSFLNGNYITLTNLSKSDMERLIKYKLSPLNVSIHAMDKEVRKYLLSNRFAANIKEQLKELVEAGIQINGQIVLCKGINDGHILDDTIHQLSEFIPDILSLTIVPVGLSKYRDDLTLLEPFDKISAKEVLEVVHKWQMYYLEKMGTRFVFASDEFYVVANWPLPSYDSYEGFGVLDNGVGMLTKFEMELERALETIEEENDFFEASIVTGKITENFIKCSVDKLKTKLPNVRIHVYAATNEFFGEMVTVTGLVTGQDIISTLKDKVHKGKVLLLAENMLKYGENVFLDDYTIQSVETQLNMPIEILPNEGDLWLSTLLGIKEKYKDE